MCTPDKSLPDVRTPLKVLQSIKHLADLPEHVLNDIANASSLQKIKEGQVIYLEG
jgi:hypothetical protein